MKQALIDRSAEPRDHNYGEQQRHGEIEVLIEESPGASERTDRARLGDLRERSGHRGRGDFVGDYTT